MGVRKENKYAEKLKKKANRKEKKQIRGGIIYGPSLRARYLKPGSLQSPILATTDHDQGLRPPSVQDTGIRDPVCIHR
jgi:hypothetical protein